MIPSSSRGSCSLTMTLWPPGRQAGRLHKPAETQVTKTLSLGRAEKEFIHSLGVALRSAYK